MKVRIWSLVVDGPNTSGLGISVLSTNEECIESLRENYLEGYDELPADPGELVDFALNEGYVVYLEDHELEVPNAPILTAEEVLAATLVILPDATIGEDNEGQVIIYTDVYPGGRPA